MPSTPTPFKADCDSGRPRIAKEHHISSQLLEWKGIEGTERLAASSNTKVVVIGNTKTGVPVMLGEK